MFKPTVRERATALVSALAAIAILGLAATAQPSRTSPSERLVRLESDLRYQLDLGSRVDRAAFEERTKELDRTLAAWRKSPQSPGDVELMTDWLRAALMQSLPGESGEWPAAPEFGTEAAEVHVARKAIAAEAGQESGVRGQSDAVVVKEGTPPTGVARTAPAPRATERLAPKQPVTVVAEKPAPAVEPSVTTKQKPARSAKAETDVARRAAPTAAQVAATYRSVKAEPVAAKPPLGRVFDPEAQTRWELGAERQAAKTHAPAPVQVNLAELSARVGGYHEGLREIEAALVANREGMTVGQVAQLVGELEQLAGQYQFVRLYYDALTRDERHFVAAPRSMAATIDLVERERARVETADVDDFLVTNEPAVEEGELAMRLKALAEVAGR